MRPLLFILLLLFAFTGYGQNIRNTSTTSTVGMTSVVVHATGGMIAAGGVTSTGATNITNPFTNSAISYFGGYGVTYALWTNRSPVYVLGGMTGTAGWTNTAHIRNTGWQENNTSTNTGHGQFATTVGIVGALTLSSATLFADNIRQTFNPGADNAGINVGAAASDPGSPVDGDLFYDSDDELFRARINGAWVNLGAAGAGGTGILPGVTNYGPWVRPAQKTVTGVLDLAGTNKWTIATNGSFEFSFSGTARHGQMISLMVSNYHITSRIFGTNTAGIYNTFVRTNSTLFEFESNAVTVVDFVYDTNFNNGGMWMIDKWTGPEWALEFSTGLSAATNGSTRTVVVSASGATATLLNEIGDAVDNGVVAMVGNMMAYTSTLNGGVVNTTTNSVADITTDTFMQEWAYRDNADANAFFWKATHNAGASIAQSLSSTLFQNNVPQTNSSTTLMAGAVGMGSTLGVAGVASFANGSVSAPGIAATADPNTGIFWNPPDVLQVTVGGVSVASVTPSDWSTTNLTVGGRLTVSPNNIIVDSSQVARPGIIGLSDTNFDAGQKYVFLSGPMVGVSNFTLRLPASAGNVGQALSIASLSTTNVVLGWASGSAITAREEDGSPSVSATTIRFSNGTMTDNGGGDVSVVTGGGAATAWDAITDPAGDATVGFAGTQQTISSSLDGGTSLTVTNTDPDNAADTIGIKVAFNDSADINSIFFQAVGDADGTPLVVWQAGAGGVVQNVAGTNSSTQLIAGAVGLGSTLTVAGATALTSSSNSTTALVAGNVGVGGNVTTAGAFIGAIDGATAGTTIKMKSYLQIQGFNLLNGATAPNTNDVTAATFMQVVFDDAADQAANYLERHIQVPDDWDAAVDPRIKLTFRLTGADTGTHRYVVSMDDVAASSAYTGTVGTAINVDFAGDGTGGANDVEQVGFTTLTGWGAAATAGRHWVIRIARDGNASEDASTVDSMLIGCVLEYGVSQ